LSLLRPFQCVRSREGFFGKPFISLLFSTPPKWPRYQDLNPFFFFDRRQGQCRMTFSHWNLAARFLSTSFPTFPGSILMADTVDQFLRAQPPLFFRFSSCPVCGSFHLPGFDTFPVPSRIFVIPDSTFRSIFLLFFWAERLEQFHLPCPS